MLLGGRVTVDDTAEVGDRIAASLLGGAIGDATLELFGDPPVDDYGDGMPPADWWNRYPGS